MKIAFILLILISVFGIAGIFLSSCDDGGDGADMCCVVKQSTYPLDEDPPDESYSNGTAVIEGGSKEDCDNYCENNTDFPYCASTYTECPATKDEAPTGQSTPGLIEQKSFLSK
jgi:hypothetical protein